MSGRLNIVYFVCHDVGRHLGCYGAQVKTPNIDRFAQEAVRFERAFCSAPCCTPSRICAMTGMYSHRSGGIGLAHMGWPLPETVRTVVDELNDAGYQTIHAGMQHERSHKSNRYEIETQREGSDGHADVAVDRALEALGNRDVDRPFYLNVGTHQPHSHTWGRAETHHGGATPLHEVYIPAGLPDTPTLRTQFAKFEAAIRFMDKAFGRLIEGLRELDLLDSTVVVFTTDHGIGGPRAKGTLYDRGTEIALLVRMPNGLPSVRAELIPNIDIAPTWLEVAGIETPEHMDGRSFWPLLDGKAYTEHDHIFTERNFHGERRVVGKPSFVDRYDPVRSLREDRYHLIWNLDPHVRTRPMLPWEAEALDSDAMEHPASDGLRPEFELYDTWNDPQELLDLSRRPELATRLDRMKREVRAWMERTDDFALGGAHPERYESPQFGDWLSD